MKIFFMLYTLFLVKWVVHVLVVKNVVFGRVKNVTKRSEMKKTVTGRLDIKNQRSTKIGLEISMFFFTFIVFWYIFLFKEFILKKKFIFKNSFRNTSRLSHNSLHRRNRKRHGWESSSSGREHKSRRFSSSSDSSLNVRNFLLNVL